MLENAILGYMSRHNLATFIKTDDEVEIYEIEKIWVSVYVDGDPRRVAAIGMNAKDEVGEHLPFQEREEWHFTSLKNSLYHKGDGEMLSIHFQYMYSNKSIRCIVCTLDEGQEEEVMSTDNTDWDSIVSFIHS